MVEEEKNLIDVLKDRGIKCSDLSNMEKDSLKDAKRFREAGFQEIAKTEEAVSDKIKSLRKRVCLLK